MMAIATYFEDTNEVKKLKKDIASMEEAIWKSGWDGAWFRRAYDDFGKVLGSKKNKEGKIFVEPQGICIMAGLGLEEWDERKKHLILFPNIWRPGMESCFSSLHSANTTCIWVKYHPTRLVIRRMPEFSATPIHGS